MKDKSNSEPAKKVYRIYSKVHNTFWGKIYETVGPARAFVTYKTKLSWDGTTRKDFAIIEFELTNGKEIPQKKGGTI